MKYNITRKYALKQYENVDIYVEGLETREEIKLELEKLDAIAEEYRVKSVEEQSKSYRVVGSKDWFVLNKEDGLLYKKEPNKSIKPAEGVEPNKERPF